MTCKVTQHAGDGGGALPDDYEKLWEELSSLLFVPIRRGIVAIDAADYPKICGKCWVRKWQRDREYTSYALSHTQVDGKRVTVYMHRHIMSALPGVDIDHKNGNGLNNHRNNLRAATRSQNIQNQVARSKTGFKGVYVSGSKFCVSIRIDGKVTSLGIWPDAAEAARMWDLYALKHRGEFAVLNFPERINEYREVLAARK